MPTLTYKNEQFFIDGEPFVIISGAMHYFRIPQEYWYDRLLKLKECGFNTVETYTCWNLHEPKEGVFDFSGMLDIEKYISVASELGLYVILRPGPYICAEWEFGGFPSWLLRYKDMAFRCNDAEYLAKVRRYYKELLSRVRKHFFSNGGNIIMLQIENEYGSYGNDKEYLREILNIYKENDIDCLFFTSDGPCYSMLNGGTLEGVLSVANFGSKPSEQFEVLREYRPDQPLMCGEYWDGWFDRWGDIHHQRPAEEIVEDFKTFMDNNWSVNMYMFHGGTNFGFSNGANYYGEIQPTITSYDYGALLSEAGDRTEAYYKCRDILVKKYGNKVPELSAKESEKKAYGSIKLTHRADLFENLDRISTPVFSAAPKFMEDVGQSFGYILYRATLNGPTDDWRLRIDTVHDRAQIFIDGEYKATYLRDHGNDEESAIRLPLGYGESVRLDILNENLGRINYGPFMRDQKGLMGIRFENQQHFGWTIYPLPMNDLSGLEFVKMTGKTEKCPAFFKGILKIEDTPCDTFLRLDGFKKGFVMINGFNLGRYYEVGPQKTLYVPAPMLKQGENEIIVFESDGVKNAEICFVDTPDLG